MSSRRIHVSVINATFTSLSSGNFTNEIDHRLLAPLIVITVELTVFLWWFWRGIFVEMATAKGGRLMIASSVAAAVSPPIPLAAVYFDLRCDCGLLLLSLSLLYIVLPDFNSSERRTL